MKRLKQQLVEAKQERQARLSKEKNEQLEMSGMLNDSKCFGGDDIVAGVQDSIESFKFSNQTSTKAVRPRLGQYTNEEKQRLMATPSQGASGEDQQQTQRSKHTLQNTISGLSTIRQSNRYNQ